MKKALFLFAIAAFVLYSTGCKKCYHCQNTCTLCVYSDSIIQNYQQKFCNDSFSSESAYMAAIAADTALGFVCAETASDYSQDYCVNKPGQDEYKDYYDRGGRVPCSPK
ncbi:MAG TPA: hypothetical protein VG603_00340 [Chitinophagales bacterium]|nr:hypothetical protein [Chitinophagales bacterium]